MRNIAKKVKLPLKEPMCQITGRVQKTNYKYIEEIKGTMLKACNARMVTILIK